MKPAFFVENAGAGLVLRAFFSRTREFYVIHKISRAARMLAAVSRALGRPVALTELRFDFFDDVHLPDGQTVIDELYFRGPEPLLKRVESDAEYLRIIRQSADRPTHEPFLTAYLSKKIYLRLTERMRPILIAAWFTRERLGASAKPILYTQADWAFDLLSEYAAGWSVEIRPLPAQGTFLRRQARSLQDRGRRFWYGAGILWRGKEQEQPETTGIAVEMYLNGVMEKGLYATNFFWHTQGIFSTARVAAYFPHRAYQPMPDRREALRRRGIDCISRRDLIRLMYRPAAPRKTGGSLAEKRAPAKAAVIAGKLGHFLLDEIQEFYLQQQRWCRFFFNSGTRIHLSTVDQFPESEALHCALEDTGGISVSVQRSIESESRPYRRTVVDVHFSFAKSGAESERRSGSRVKQFVVSGYPYDGIFELAGEYGKGLSRRMRAAGVEFTLCFLDQGFGINPKTLGGAQIAQGGYRFLCDRLEHDPTLGLIVKPKKSDFLKGQLGPVWPQMERLIGSGRCILLEGGSVDKQFLPAVAACGADLAINLSAGATAGLESYLAGTRTLLIRHITARGAFEDIPASAQILFDSWEELWRAVERYRVDPDNREIGNWEPVIERFVSLRDGRAAERIGCYLRWLCDSLGQGRSRGEALRDAEERYGLAWGKDLIFRVDGTGPDGVEEPRGEEMRCAAADGR